MDSLACGMVGILTTARSRQAALDGALHGLKFIKRIVSGQQLHKGSYALVGADLCCWPR